MINLTPNDIVVRLDDRDIVYPASGHVARVSVDPVRLVALADGCPIRRVVYGRATIPSLPLPQNVRKVIEIDKSDGQERYRYVDTSGIENAEKCEIDMCCYNGEDGEISLTWWPERQDVIYDTEDLYHDMLVEVDTDYIVSTMFAQAYLKQTDNPELCTLFTPDTGPDAIRADGRIVAVRALIRHTSF